MRAALTLRCHAGAMNTQTNRTLTAALALALAVGLSACGSSDNTVEGVDAQSPSAVETTDESTPPTSDDATTSDAAATTGGTEETSSDAGSSEDAADEDLTAIALRAIDTAEKEAGGTAYEIDDQDRDGTWEVDVAVDGSSVEVTVSEDGRSVVRTEDDGALDDDDKAGLAKATITLQDAIRLAIDEVGGVLDDAELEEENGTHYWEVEVDGTDRGDDIEVNVSVEGKVLSVDS